MSRFSKIHPGPANAPDLGVLEIFTPVAWVGDGAAAGQLCGDLNGSTTTNQWVVVPKQDNSRRYAKCLLLRCAFVVGVHNTGALEAFVAWCVAEQVSRAAAHIAEGDILRKVTGKPCLFDGLEAGSEEAQEVWHEDGMSLATIWLSACKTRSSRCGNR